MECHNCNHFVCLSVCPVYLFSVCVHIYILRNTGDIMMLYHEAFMYFLLGEGGQGFAEVRRG